MNDINQWVEDNFDKVDTYNYDYFIYELDIKIEYYSENNTFELLIGGESKYISYELAKMLVKELK